VRKLSSISLYNAARLADQGRPCSVETSMSKLLRCKGAAEVTQIHERVTAAYLRPPVVGGSSNIQKNNIANRLKLGA
jgi:hypothetical protein